MNYWLEYWCPGVGVWRNCVDGSGRELVGSLASMVERARSLAAGGRHARVVNDSDLVVFEI